ncbi:MAG: peptidoglycan recognition protein family protein, partial [Gammaproteobacteria bacterium]
MIVVTRVQWGARYKDGFEPAPIPTEWWLHHSAGLMPDLEWLDADRDGVDDDEGSVMRQLEHTGQTRFGGGMSYTWLVPPSGRAYVGHSMGRQGAHTKNRNDRARGICLIGNYSTNRPTTAQLDTIAAIMVTEYRAGRSRTFVLNGGHRDLQSTECPGDHAWALIKEINHRARTLAAGSHTTPAPTPGEDPVSEIALPRTDPPTDWDSPWSTWPQREEVIHLGWVKGQHGWHTIRLAVGHPGGYLKRAHVDYPNGVGKGATLLWWVNPDEKQSHDLEPP